MQCPAFQVRLACSSHGDVDVVSGDNSKGVPEECQWEMLANGELCVINCPLDHSRLTWAGKETNQLDFVSVDPINPMRCCIKTQWRLVECGDGSVEICSCDYSNYLALVDHQVTLTDSAQGINSHRWSIIRNAIRGVRIKSSAQGLYLCKVEGKLVVRNPENAIGDAFLWSLDPAHGCKFYAWTELVPTNIEIQLKLCSNGTAVVTGPRNEALPSGFDLLSILEYSSCRVRIKHARTNKYLDCYRVKCCRIELKNNDSPVDWNIKAADGSMLLGLAPWMLPAAVRKNAPKSWIGHQKPMERTFDMPPSLRRPFANWRCWPIDAPSEVKVEGDSTGNSPVPTRVEIPDGTSRTVLDGQVRRSGRKRTKIDVSRVVPEAPLSDTTRHQD